MAITNFIPQIWSAKLLASLKKTQVYAQPGVVNTDYQGEIANQGDTVRITSISRPTVASYSKNVTTLSPENLTDAQRSLLIDQAKYVDFEIDDIDLAQSASGGELMSQAMSEASYGLADTADQLVAGLYTGAQSANQIGTVSVTTADLAFTQVRKLMVKLDEANVPRTGRYCVIPPWYHGLLLERSGLIQVADAGTADGLRNGQVGRLLGFDLLVSNNAVNVTGDDYAVLAGVPSAITYASQISKMEAFRPENAFSDAVKILHVYGAKVIRPDAIATVVASIT